MICDSGTFYRWTYNWLILKCKRENWNFVAYGASSKNIVPFHLVEGSILPQREQKAMSDADVLGRWNDITDRATQTGAHKNIMLFFNHRMANNEGVEIPATDMIFDLSLLARSEDEITQLYGRFNRACRDHGAPLSVNTLTKPGDTGYNDFRESHLLYEQNMKYSVNALSGARLRTFAEPEIITPPR